MNRRFGTVGYLVLVAVLCALAAALVPPATANYTVIAIGGERVLKSADTALLAAGFVLSVMLLFLCPLVFGVWAREDRRSGLDALTKTSPAPSLSTHMGMLFSNFLALGFALLVASVVFSATVALQYGRLPGAAAYLAYAGVLLPTIGLVLVAGFVLDALLPPSPFLRSIALFVIVIAVMFASLLGVFDVLGLSVMQTAIGEDRSRALSFGIIVTEEGGGTPWRAFAPGTISATLAHLGRFPLVLVPLLGAIPLAARLARRPTVSRGAARLQASVAATLNDGVPGSVSAVSLPTSCQPGSGASLLSTAHLTLRRILRGKPGAWFVLGASFLASLAGAPVLLCLSGVYLFLYLTYRTTDFADIRLSKVHEPLQPGYARLPASVFVWSGLLVLGLFALLPVLVRLAPLHAGTAALGLAAVVAGFELTFRRLDKPLLGTAVFALLYYILAFNETPPDADVLGLRAGTSVSAILAGGLALALATLLFQRPATR